WVPVDGPEHPALVVGPVLPPSGHARALPALLVDDGSSDVVADDVCGPASLRGVDATRSNLVAGRQFAAVEPGNASRSCLLWLSVQVDATSVDVECPRPPLQDVLSERQSFLERLAGEDDGLVGGLERGGPALPLLGFLGRRGSDGDDLRSHAAGVGVRPVGAALLLDGLRGVARQGARADDLPLGAELLVDRLVEG